MTDLEMIKKCAEKMKSSGEFIAVNQDADGIWVQFPDECGMDYDPLHDDAQAMALVKKFAVHIAPMPEEDYYAVWIHGIDCKADNKDLNRAIVECVSKLDI